MYNMSDHHADHIDFHVPLVPTTEGHHQTLGENILMRSIKMIDIGYIFAIYFVIAFVLVIITDKIIGKFDPVANYNTSSVVICIELLLQFWIYGVLCYIVRNVIELIPFPLNGYHGFIHSKVKELGSAWVFGYVYLTFSNNMKSRLTFLYNRSLGIPNPKKY